MTRLKNEEKSLPPIPVIDGFLAQWKTKAMEYYLELQAENKIEINKQHPITEDTLKLITKINYKTWKEERKYTDEQITQLLLELETMSQYKKNNLQMDINHTMYKRWQQQHHKSELMIIQNTEERINEILDQEVRSKKISLIRRITEKAGDIVDTAYLYLGDNKEINGKIIGSIKTVIVQTIYAGGYNIQRLHYRVLVKELK